MKLGLQLYGPLAKGTMDEVEMLGKMQKIGMEMVEPCIFFRGEQSNPAFWSVKKFEQLYPMLKEMGLEVISCHVVSDPLAEDLPMMCEMARKYGIRHFIMKMAYPIQMENIQRTAELYKNLADGLKDSGARILIHNGQPDVGVTIDGVTAYEYMIRCCDGKVGMQFDLGWCAAGGVEPMEILKRSAKWIESLHFKDFVDPGVSQQDIYIGGGCVDSAPFVQYGLAEKLPMFVDQDCYEDLVTDAEKSYKYLMSLK